MKLRLPGPHRFGATFFLLHPSVLPELPLSIALDSQTSSVLPVSIVFAMGLAATAVTIGEGWDSTRHRPLFHKSCNCSARSLSSECPMQTRAGPPPTCHMEALSSYFHMQQRHVQAESGSFRSALAASPTQGGRQLTHCHQSPVSWHLWVAASASLARQQVDSFQVEAWLACPTKQRRRRMGCLFERVSLSAPEAM